MKVGDLVVAKYDVARGIHCVGIITDINNNERFNLKIHWALSGRYGWWQEEKLKKFE